MLGKKKAVAEPLPVERPRDFAEREDLRARKLRAEVESLELQNEAGRNARNARPGIDWKGWVPIIISVVTLGLTAATFGRELHQYLEQRSQEYEVKSNERIIALAQKLAQKDPNADPVESRTNAVLLSTFEEDALPVLFEHLRASTADNQEAILHALELIQQKDTVEDGLVAAELLGEARQAFARYDADVAGTANFVAALGRLGGEDKQGSLGLLAGLRKRVLAAGGAPAGILAPMIEEACRQLAGENCPQEI